MARPINASGASIDLNVSKQTCPLHVNHAKKSSSHLYTILQYIHNVIYSSESHQFSLEKITKSFNIPIFDTLLQVP